MRRGSILYNPSMQILILASFVISMTVLENPPDMPCPAEGSWCLAAIGVYLVLVAALNGLNTLLSLRAMEAGFSGLPAPSRRSRILNALVQLVLVGGAAGIIAAGFGRWIKEDTPLNALPLLVSLTAMTPFFAALILVWLTEYPLHRALRTRMATTAGPAAPAVWTLKQYVLFNCRHHLLFIAVPICMILLSRDLLHQYLPPLLAKMHLGEWRDGIVMGASLAASAMVFFVAPVVVVRIWKTRRLPDGPLRAELERTCRRMKLKYRQILIWESSGVIANAGVMGLASPVRYILLSDALLEQMDDRQIAAIFAHEAGHVMEHHIFYSLVFAVATAMLCGSAASGLEWLFHWGERWTEAAGIAILAVTWGLGFGWISRRFEWQSDAISAWMMSGDEAAPGGEILPVGAQAFGSALRMVADINGIGYRQRNWRHGTIGQRIEQVMYLAAAGLSRKIIDGIVGRIKLGLWFALALAILISVLEAKLGK